MPIERLILIGAGGHAKVVLNAFVLARTVECLIEVFDEDPGRQGGLLGDHIVQAPPAYGHSRDTRFHVAVGAAHARSRLYFDMIAAGWAAETILHPTAAIADCASLGEGSFVAAQTVVAPDARLGVSVIVNHGAIVDHDCVVGDFSHIAPNVTLGGGVHVGAHVLVGASATILPGVTIGDGAVIAAGATVVRDVEAGKKVIFALIPKNGSEE